MGIFYLKSHSPLALVFNLCYFLLRNPINLFQKPILKVFKFKSQRMSKDVKSRAIKILGSNNLTRLSLQA